ncbi:magnesium transporter MgtE N-terminal domain-containing protein [Streptomyces sp. NPDC094448]|uniref:magnesium transporter MgtE N-terminal domain-containing protein n=1 Tax=Streptomyces sp. NPDC094448 TaxID=3366063 RepID=UPI0038050FB4
MTGSLGLAELVGRPLRGRDGEVVGRLSDVVVRLRGPEYPLVTGVVGRLGRREVFLSVEQVAGWGGDGVTLTSGRVNVRVFRRREGEVLLRADVLGHRLIDVREAEFARVYNVLLEAGPEGWAVTRVSTRRRLPRWLPRSSRRAESGWRDWKSFEPLIGHTALAPGRRVLGRLGRLKPADLADLLEEADRRESREILRAVGTDPELEADVFEELEPDAQTRLLRERSDGEIAAVLGRMRADDAADAVGELPQDRRQSVLDALGTKQRLRVLTLLGFHPSSAGGLMSLDVLKVPGSSTAEEALVSVRAARTLQSEALTSIFMTREGDRLAGVLPLVQLLQSDPAARLGSLADVDPVRVGPDTDVEDVALLMTDHNLLVVPVVDDTDRILGVITVDDVLEVIVPRDWRQRSGAPRPSPRPRTPPPGRAGPPASA